MNQIQNNNSSLMSKFVTGFVIIAGLMGIYYLYKYLFSTKSASQYTLLGGITKADIDQGKPITIQTMAMPGIYEGGEFSVSMWLNVVNWNYRKGLAKHIMSIGGNTFDTMRIYLGGNKPKLHIRFQTRDPSAAYSPGSYEAMTSENLAKTDYNAVFNTIQTDSGLLDDMTPLCDLPEIDLQKWVNITVCANGKTIDVYFDGKLARSCVLPSFYKVDAGGYTGTLLAYGGFGGQIANVAMYEEALNPEAVHGIYMSGPTPITNFGTWITSFFEPQKSV
jgi:hypothetical protein